MLNSRCWFIWKKRRKTGVAQQKKDSHKDIQGLWVSRRDNSVLKLHQELPEENLFIRLGWNGVNGGVPSVSPAAISHLSSKDVAKTCLKSKTWCNTWLTPCFIMFLTNGTEKNRVFHLLRSSGRSRACFAGRAASTTMWNLDAPCRNKSTA